MMSYVITEQNIKADSGITENLSMPNVITPSLSKCQSFYPQKLIEGISLVAAFGLGSLRFTASEKSVESRTVIHWLVLKKPNTPHEPLYISPSKNSVNLLRFTFSLHQSHQHLLAPPFKDQNFYISFIQSGECFHIKKDIYFIKNH